MKLSVPHISRKDLRSVGNVLKSGWISTSSKTVDLFEKKLSKFCKTKYSIVLNSGTSAIHLALKILGVNKNSEVIVPSLTFIATVNPVLYLGAKPIIFDADNGGRLEHLPYMIKSLERSGVSAVIIEDKIGLKKNSLFKNQDGAKQDTIKSFCQKIIKAKDTKISDDFLIIARIESFILGKSLDDAMKRAEAYSKAGADAILIHSKDNTPSKVFAFAKKFTKSKYFKPMVAVPSSYSKTYEKDLIKNGFKIIIYANHMMRASYPAMLDVAKSILINKRSFNAEKKISSIKEIINLIK